MSINTTKRDIRHEIADAIALLGNEYTTTNIECSLGDSAIKITKQNNSKTMYIIAYSNPDDTEMHLYDGPDLMIIYHVFHDGSLYDSTPEDIADYIIKNL